MQGNIPSGKKGDRAAIVVFAFNRPRSLARLAQSLTDCSEFSNHPLYIFIDGVRGSSDATHVTETLRIADAIQHPQKTVVHRSNNLGLQASLRLGITEVLETHESVIVLEDDLVLAPHALTYFQDALYKYIQDQRFVSVCGYAPIDVEDAANSQNTACFLPMTHPWGWATWKDRWQDHQRWLLNSVDKDLLASSALRSAINVFGIRNYVQMLRAAEAGLISSWWVYWQYYATLNHQVSVFPPKTMVVNLGMQDGGTHAGRWNFLRFIYPKRVLYNGKIQFPNRFAIDFALLDQIPASREARLLRIHGILGMVSRKIRKALKR